MNNHTILHSTVLGKGSPLLILHGYFGMSDNWKTLGNRFSDTFEVHLIDQRNHGRSFHESVFNYDVLVEDLKRYIVHYNLEKCSLIGHSMGGKTAMLFAVKYPELLHNIVVVDISPRFYEPHHNAILAALNSVDFSVDTSRKLVENKLEKLIPEIGVRQFLLKNVYWKEKGQLAYRFNLDSLTFNNKEVGAALPPHTVFNKETLFLKGENSNYITEKEEATIYTHFPEAIIKEIKNAGHWLHAENPTQFYDEVIHFLQ